MIEKQTCTESASASVRSRREMEETRANSNMAISWSTSISSSMRDVVSFATLSRLQSLGSPGGSECSRGMEVEVGSRRRPFVMPRVSRPASTSMSEAEK